MPTDNPMTYDELINNYEFKIAKKMLLREYPWIKDVDANKDEVNRWNLIFLEITIDPYELGREKDWTVAKYIKNMVRNDGEYWAPYLSTFFSNATFEDTHPIQQEIERALESIHTSPAFPIELRLPGTRKFNVGRWYAYPNTITPEDTPQLSQ
jgi:hypothetical protein